MVEQISPHYNHFFLLTILTNQPNCHIIFSLPLLSTTESEQEVWGERKDEDELPGNYISNKLCYF